MYVQDCSLSECLPPHTATSPRRLEAIRASMALYSWVGRPLLGWWDEAHGVVRLLTGSCRYAAAKAAQRQLVPVALVEVAEGRLEGRGEELYLDGQRLSDFCGGALMALLEAEDPAAASLLAADCGGDATSAGTGR